MTPDDYLFLLHYGMGFLIGLVLVPLIISDLWDTKAPITSRPYTRTVMNFIFVVVLSSMVIRSMWPFYSLDLTVYDYYGRGYGWDLLLDWLVACVIVPLQFVAIPVAGYLVFKRLQWLSQEPRHSPYQQNSTEPMRHAKDRRGTARR